MAAIHDMSVPHRDNVALRRRLDYAGPALFSAGFRPFFLAAAAWAALGILFWLPQVFGMLSLSTHLHPVEWHIHEMLFGYVAAAIAGFLLTAIPNWTGRLPVNGAPLAGLVALWLAGRVALLLSAEIGGALAAAIDLSFLVALAAVAAREIIAGENWRNLRVLLALGLLIAGNATFHAEVLAHGAADYGIRLSIAAVVMLLSLIGGRIIPSFTNNWLVRTHPRAQAGRLPVPFSRFDAVVLAASGLALLMWVAAPDWGASGALLLAAGALQAIRLARWAGDRTVADRLVLVLHVGYAFVPLGFFLLGCAALSSSVPGSAGIHAFTVGGFGMMTLAVMTRASLGHLKRPLVASAATQAIYALCFVAALTRIVATFNGAPLLIEIAGAAWTLAFAGFVVSYGPMLAGWPPPWRRASA